MMEPIYYLDRLVALLDPFVMALRAPAAVVLFAIVAFRPKSPSFCIMMGRVLVLAACVLWVAAIVPGFRTCGALGNWIMFASAMASHVCEVVLNWAAVLAAKRAEYPSPFARIWHAIRHRQERPV